MAHRFGVATQMDTMVLYGKGAETLGIDTKKADLDKLKGGISDLYDEMLFLQSL